MNFMTRHHLLETYDIRRSELPGRYQYKAKPSWEWEPTNLTRHRKYVGFYTASSISQMNNMPSTEVCELVCVRHRVYSYDKQNRTDSISVYLTFNKLKQKQWQKWLFNNTKMRCNYKICIKFEALCMRALFKVKTVFNIFPLHRWRCNFEHVWSHP